MLRFRTRARARTKRRVLQRGTFELKERNVPTTLAAGGVGGSRRYEFLVAGDHVGSTVTLGDVIERIQASGGGHGWDGGQLRFLSIPGPSDSELPKGMPGSQGWLQNADEGLCVRVTLTRPGGTRHLESLGNSLSP